MKNNRAYQLSEITYNAVLEDAKASSYEKLFAILKKAIPLNEHLEFHLAQLNKLNF